MHARYRIAMLGTLALALTAVPAFAASATHITKTVDEGTLAVDAWTDSSNLYLDYSFTGSTSLNQLGVNIGLAGDTPAWRASMEMWHEDMQPWMGSHPTTAVGDYLFAWNEASPTSGNDPTWGATDTIGKDELPDDILVSIASFSGTGSPDEFTTSWTIPLSVIGEAHDPTAINIGDNLLIGGAFDVPPSGYRYANGLVWGDQETYTPVNVVPSPAAAGAGLMLLAGLGLRRRSGPARE